MNLKTRAMVVAAAVLFLVMAVNTLVTISVATSKYHEALIARTTALAEGTWKDIAKAIGFGIPLSALDGMSDKLRGMMETDRDLSSVMIMDADGKVLYAADRGLDNTVPGDEPGKKALAANEPIVQPDGQDGRQAA